MRAHKDLFLHLVRGDGDRPTNIASFMRISGRHGPDAEFYLQTVDTVFVQHLMTRRSDDARGQSVDLAAIRRPALMTTRARTTTSPAPASAARARSVLEYSGREQAHYECPRVGHTVLQRFPLPLADRAAYGEVHARNDPCASTSLTIAQLEHMATMPHRQGRRHELEKLAFASLRNDEARRGQEAAFALSPSRHRTPGTIGRDSNKAAGTTFFC